MRRLDRVLAVLGGELVAAEVDYDRDSLQPPPSPSLGLYSPFLAMVSNKQKSRTSIYAGYHAV